MKKSIVVVTALLLSLPLMLGSGQLVVQNSDLLFVTGEGSFSVVNGTRIYKHEEDGVWTGFYSRNAGSLGIELAADDGIYHVETWSIPSDPMFPMRVHEVITMEVGDIGIPQPNPVDGAHLLQLLNDWGPCSGVCPYDFNGDGVIDGLDLLYLLSIWGEPWPG